MIADCRRLFWLSALIALLTACQSRLPHPIADLEFTVAGKIGFKQDGRGQSARFSWLQYADGYEIEVWGPLGQGRVRLTGNFSRMAVYRGDELQRLGPTGEVMQATLGWSIPIEVLRAWVEGVPHENHAVSDVVRDEMGLYGGFSQAGWAVLLSKYKNRPSGPESGPESLQIQEKSQNAEAIGLQTPGKLVARKLIGSNTVQITVSVVEFTPSRGAAG